ncbi:hypothetical protein K227x_30940 [Rubripirellula lacrimiformis]|uniref:Uncharacterized protein n=1 Tax=Rubripirellula lacrimiformis TaxID=1930273 RepID=A0A517NC44_9BACT|nr:hypothetical protein K227x_30940 [Rubripirellula lacrimiformis]
MPTGMGVSGRQPTWWQIHQRWKDLSARQGWAFIPKDLTSNGTRNAASRSNPTLLNPEISVKQT